MPPTRFCNRFGSLVSWAVFRRGTVPTTQSELRVSSLPENQLNSNSCAIGAEVLPSPVFHLHLLGRAAPDRAGARPLPGGTSAPSPKALGFDILMALQQHLQLS